MKKKIKGKNYAVFYFAGKRKIFIYYLPLWRTRGQTRRFGAHSALPSLDGDARLPRVSDRVGPRRFSYERFAF
jgi:hypothetical protein